VKLLVMQSSPLPCYLSPLRPKYRPHSLILENPQQCYILAGNKIIDQQRSCRIGKLTFWSCLLNARVCACLFSELW
jgi:hypothetical protein